MLGARLRGHGQWWSCAVAAQRSCLPVVHGRRAQSSGSGSGERRREGAKKERVERNHWSQGENVREAMDRVAKAFDVQSPGDWRRVSLSDVGSVIGKGITGRYSVREMLSIAFPEREWRQEECRPQVEQSYWDERENRERFLLRVKEESKATHWSELTVSEVTDRGGGGLLRRFGGSLSRAIAESVTMGCKGTGETYEGVRGTMALGRVPRGFWSSRENRRAWLKGKEEKLGVRETKDWCHVTQSMIRRFGGGALLNLYGGSWQRARADLLEECLPFLERENPMESRSERERFMRGLGEELGIVKPEEWSRVKKQQLLAREGGKNLLSLYGNALHRCLEDLIPGYKEKKSEGRHDWRSVEARRAFIKTLAEKHGVTEPSHWKRVSADDIRKENGGKSLLRRYQGSVGALLVENLPDVTLTDVRNRAERGHWSKRENRRKFIERAAEELGITRPEDWSRVTSASFRSLGGSALLDHYNGSLYAALKDINSEDKRDSDTSHDTGTVAVTPGVDDKSEWERFKVRAVIPREYWEVKENVRLFLSHLQQELGLRTKMDWYRVSRRQIREYNGGGLLSASRSWLDVLQATFPDEDWRGVDSLALAKKSTQRNLLERLCDLFTAESSESSSFERPDVQGGKFLTL